MKEATFQGYHTPVVQLGLRYGMLLFIASEVMFFVGFFWAFFNLCLFPTAQIGQCGRRQGIHTFDPFHLPFLNTLILLLSGTTVTWAHHALLEGDRKGLRAGAGAHHPAGPHASPACQAYRVRRCRRSQLLGGGDLSARPSSWRPASTASTSSSAPSS